MMEPIVQVKLAETQLSQTSIFLNSKATPSTPKDSPFLVKLFNQVCSMLLGSLLPEISWPFPPLSPQISPDRLSSTARIKPFLRTNASGLEIIKRFEKFPPDVEPDVREAERIVRRSVTVPLTSNQFSALVSFTYNLGQATFQESHLLKYLNAGRYRAAAREFDAWVYIGSRRSPALMARRVAERGLFLRSEA